MLFEIFKAAAASASINNFTRLTLGLHVAMAARVGVARDITAAGATTNLPVRL